MDEEQRFGVRQKELLRQLKLKVDVLSMSATPIPRTLQMSLAGLRDISVIETPPEGRTADPHLRRPLRRGAGARARSSARRSAAARRSSSTTGSTRCHETAERLRALCPGVRFAEAHGQMDEAELERTMLEFLRGDADCLVATTIIESGLDIPQANTLIVERADELGLAQAYQIRGRVGRSRERAYAYLLYPVRGGARARRPRPGSRRSPTTPSWARASRSPCGTSSFAAPATCWATSSRGTWRRSGSSSTCRCWTRPWRSCEPRTARSAAEAGVRLDVDVDAYLPAEYIPFEAAKIDVHRRVAGARETGELRALRDELRDRFGPVAGAGREPARAPARPDRARAGSARRTVEFRGGRLSATPIELDAATVGRLRERIPEAMYESRVKTLSVRVPDEPEARLAAVLGLAEAAAQALAEPIAA